MCMFISQNLDLSHQNYRQSTSLLLRYPKIFTLQFNFIFIFIRPNQVNFDVCPETLNRWSIWTTQTGFTLTIGFPPRWNQNWCCLYNLCAILFVHKYHVYHRSVLVKVLLHKHVDCFFSESVYPMKCLAFANSMLFAYIIFTNNVCITRSNPLCGVIKNIKLMYGKLHWRKCMWRYSPKVPKYISKAYKMKPCYFYRCFISFFSILQKVI